MVAQAILGSLVGPVVELGGKFLDSIFTSDEEREAAKLKLFQAQQEGRLAEMEANFSIMLKEAGSRDKWTSRARPAFLYVMYFVIILCVIGGIIGIWYPTEVDQAATNIGNLLHAIPENLWWLFGTGYLGYTGARSFDKWRSVK